MIKFKRKINIKKNKIKIERMEKLSNNYIWSNFNIEKSDDSKYGKYSYKCNIVIEYRITEVNEFLYNLEIGLNSLKNIKKCIRNICNIEYELAPNKKQIVTFILSGDKFGLRLLKMNGFHEEVCLRQACKINNSFHDIIYMTYTR